MSFVHAKKLVDSHQPKRSPVRSWLDSVMYIVMVAWIGAILIEALALTLGGMDVVGQQFDSFKHNSRMCETLVGHRKHNEESCRIASENLAIGFWVTLLSRTWNNVHLCGGKHCTDFAHDTINSIPATIVAIVVTLFLSPSFIKATYRMLRPSVWRERRAEKVVEEHTAKIDQNMRDQQEEQLREAMRYAAESPRMPTYQPRIWGGVTQRNSQKNHMRTERPVLQHMSYSSPFAPSMPFIQEVDVVDDVTDDYDLL
jgi:hypothetical protein